MENPQPKPTSFFFGGHCGYESGQCKNLPGIILPTSTVVTRDWRKSLFASVVYRTDYSNASQLAFLKEYLVGDLSKDVQNFDIVDENYDTVWSLLCDRDDNVRLQTAAIIEKLVTKECYLTFANLNIGSNN